MSNRQRLLDEYTIEDSGKRILATDKLFSSPSTAATFCVGRSCNGWVEWKDKEGKTLDFIYRDKLE